MKSLQKYFAYYYNEETDNLLLENSYRGHIEQVQKYIDDGINIYSRTPDMHETPLYLAIVGGHPEIVNILLNLYEQDIKFIVQAIGLQPKIQPILIGFGVDDIENVEQLFNEYEQCEVRNNYIDNNSKCVVILLKRDNFSPVQVLYLSPQSDRGKLITTRIIRRVIKNGVLDMNATTRNDVSLIKVAAASGSTEIFYKLLNFGAGINCIDEIVLCAIKFGHIKFLDDIAQKYEFKMTKIYEMEEFKSAVFQSRKWNIFEHVVNKIVIEQKYTWPQIVNSLFHDAVLYNHLEIVKNCLRYNLSLTTKNLHGNIPLHDLYLCNKTKHLVMQMIEIDPSQLEIRDVTGYSVVHKLALANRMAELTQIYEKYPDAKNIFFQNQDVGLMAIEIMISRNHYEMTKLIIQNTIRNTELLYHLLNKIAIGDNLELFQFAISLDSYDFTLQPRGGEYHVLITALFYQNLEMFKAIKSQTSFDLNQIKTGDGLNVLRFAIWTKRPVFNLAQICCKRSGSEENSDSEDSVLAKRRPKIAPDSTYDPFKITERDLLLRDEFNNLFDHLIDEGLDYRTIDADGKNLLHHSVDAKNVFTTSKLLVLGVEPNVYDDNGNLPIHYSRNAEIFKVVYTCGYKPHTNCRNKINGKSLLHYLTEQTAELSTLTLICFILEHGGDINAIDHLNRSPIYYANDLEVVKLLLEYHPNINMQDVNGETPIHSAFERSRFDIANLLLEQAATDYTIMNKDGISYLACFTNERNVGQDYAILFPNVVTLGNQKFRHLLKTHCNDRNKFGTPIFFEAIGISDILSNLLLDVVDDLNIFVRNPQTGDTALHVAVRFGKFGMADKLIERGLLIEEKNMNGDTCLLLCCERSLTKLEHFLTYRPQVNIKNENGISPMVYASYVDITGDAICDLLLNGGDISDCDPNGQTAYENFTNELKQIFKFLHN